MSNIIEDAIIPHKVNGATINPKIQKQPVKIVLPSLAEFSDDTEDEPIKKKHKPLVIIKLITITKKTLSFFRKDQACLAFYLNQKDHL